MKAYFYGRKKIRTFLRPKYFFDAALFVFVNMKYIFVLHQFFLLT